MEPVPKDFKKLMMRSIKKSSRKMCMMNWLKKLMSLMLVNLLKKNYDNNTGEAECKIPSITGFATTAALTAVENKIPEVSVLVKK